MTEKTRKYLVYSLLPVAIIWAAFNFTGDDKKEENTPKPPQPIVSTAKPITETTNIDFEKYSALAWGKDPFYRGTKPAPKIINRIEEKKWRLAGILYGIDNHHAVINKKIVKKGDIINGARVVMIEKDLVTLEKNGSEIKLTIAKDES